MTVATTDLLLVTGRTMPEPDPEVHLLVDALTERGVRADVVPWGAGTDWTTAGLTVIRSPWDYTEQPGDFLGWARAAATSAPVVNPPTVLTWNAHKGYLAELAAAGVRVVPTTFARRGVSADELVAALDGFDDEVVVKPAVSAGAVGVLRAPADAPETLAHLRELTAAGDAMVQPFVESVVTRGETSVLLFGGAHSHTVRKVPAEGDFRVQTVYGAQTVQVEPTAAELALAGAALAAVPGEVTYARVDLVEVDGAPALMELELIEPELFLPYAPGSAGRLADHLVALLD
jgi:glutathione synthase/RimK-type ligase-like ATP-grasp enzyme